MSKVDILSRRANWTEGVERNNENQVMLKKEWLEIRAMKKGQLLIKEAEEEIIEKSKAKNDEVSKVVEKIKKKRVKVLRNYEW